ATIYPDSWYGNQVQAVKSWFYPGELNPVPGHHSETPKVEVCLVHGIFSDNDNQDKILDYQKTVELWDPLLLYLSNDPIDNRGLKFDKCFNIRYFRYDWKAGPWRNAQALRAKYEGILGVDDKDTPIILISHSMGGLVGMCERSIPGSRVIGLIGCGVPVDGSPFADREGVYAQCMAEQGPVVGKVVADYLTRRLDFSSEGMKWLRPIYGPREDAWQQLSFDDSYYFLAGERTAVNPKSEAGKFTLAMLFDAVAVEHDDYLLSTELYGYGAYLIESMGYGANDGTVPADSALARGLGKGPWRYQISDCDHSQIIRGNGGSKSFEIISDALWQLYDSIPNKVAEDFGPIEEIRLDLSWSEDLSGFVPRLKSPIKWWSQDGNSLRVVCEDGQALSLRVHCEAGYEVDVDSSGWWIAIPSSSGLVVMDLEQGRSIQTVSGNVTAVGWSDTPGILAYVDDGSVQLLDVNTGFFRTLMVASGMRLTTRLVVVDESIYFADQRQAGFDVYRIDAIRQTYDINQAVLMVSDATSPPRRLKDSVVVMTRSDVVTSADWILEGGSPQDMELKQILNQGIITGGSSPVFRSCNDIAMSSDGETILLIDGRAMVLNYLEARKYLDEAKSKRRSLLRIDRSKWPDTVKVVVDKDALFTDQFPADSIGGR
ncbi:MAG: hypothetical protein R3B38_02815, partial [Patescibacteria group bacterium]